MTLPEIIGLIQGEVGVVRDRKFGPVTGAAVLAALRARHQDDQGSVPAATTAEAFQFDARSEKNLASLDPKAQPAFRNFLALAKGVAASLGCDYRMISGFRSWQEQDDLYAQGRTRPGSKVTNARGGYSWHNFRVAGDFGVFSPSGVYHDDGSRAEQMLAERVHKACSMVAEQSGLAWGGNWKTSKDTPHFQILDLPASPTAAHRKLFTEKGSVL